MIMVDKRTLEFILTDQQEEMEGRVEEVLCQRREEGVLGAAVNTISGKVDTINEHIDQVMEDAPTKLKVSVNVSDADWQKMQELHAQWLGQER